MKNRGSGQNSSGSEYISPPTHLTFEHDLTLEAFGVTARIRYSAPDFGAIFLESFDDCMPSNSFREAEVDRPDAEYFYEWSASGSDDRFFGPIETPIVAGERAARIDMLSSFARLRIGEMAPGRVFIHAGVVVLDGKALVIPATSYAGKTTLVRKLVELGASYYSDEYAVFNSDGLVEPFASKLSIRNGAAPYVTDKVPPHLLTSRVGGPPVKVAAVVCTNYRDGAEWRPRQLATGEGVLEILKNSLSIRSRPEFNFEVLQKAAANAIFLSSERGDASVPADYLIHTLRKRA